MGYANAHVVHACSACVLRGRHGRGIRAGLGAGVFASGARRLNSEAQRQDTAVEERTCISKRVNTYNNKTILEATCEWVRHARDQVSSAMSG